MRASSHARGSSRSRGDDLADDSEVGPLLSAQLLAGEEEVAAAVRPEELLPEDVDAVTRHEVGREVRQILKDRVLGGDHDVREQRELGMDERRPIDGADPRHLDVEQVVEQALLYLSLYWSELGATCG
jgi:hypothetical protein